MNVSSSRKIVEFSKTEIDVLPDEVLNHIFTFLEDERLKLSLVSRRFYFVVTSIEPSFWKKRFEKKYHDDFRYIDIVDSSYFKNISGKKTNYQRLMKKVEIGINEISEMNVKNFRNWVKMELISVVLVSLLIYLVFRQSQILYNISRGEYYLQGEFEILQSRWEESEKTEFLSLKSNMFSSWKLPQSRFEEHDDDERVFFGNLEKYFEVDVDLQSEQDYLSLKSQGPPKISEICLHLISFSENGGIQMEDNIGCCSVGTISSGLFSRIIHVVISKTRTNTKPEHEDDSNNIIRPFSSYEIQNCYPEHLRKSPLQRTNIEHTINVFSGPDVYRSTHMRPPIFPFFDIGNGEVQYKSLVIFFLFWVCLGGFGIAWTALSFHRLRRRIKKKFWEYEEMWKIHLKRVESLRITHKFSFNFFAPVLDYDEAVVGSLFK